MLHIEYDPSAQNTQATTTQTLTWRPDRITQKRGLIGLVLVMTTVQFQHLTQFITKVKGKARIDWTPAQYQYYLQRFSKRFASAAFPATTATTIFIPFYNVEYDEGDPRRYLQQLEPGDVQFELGINNTPGAGTVQLGWVYADEQATEYFEVTRKAMGVAASSSRTPVDFELEEGRLVDGIMLNTTGVTDAELWADYGTKEQPNRIMVDHYSDVFMIAKQLLDDGSAVTNPIVHRMDTPLPGRLKLILTTAAGWAGAANEWVIFARNPARAA